MPTWIEALKIWNKDKPTWCIPKKDTAEYQQVKKIMGTGKQVKKAETCECKGKKLCDKPKKTQAPTKTAPKKTPAPKETAPTKKTPVKTDTAMFTKNEIDGYLREYIGSGSTVKSKIKKDKRALKALIHHFEHIPFRSRQETDSVDVLKRYAGICSNADKLTLREILAVWDNKGRKAEKINEIIDVMTQFIIEKKKKAVGSYTGNVYFSPVDIGFNCMSDDDFKKVIDFIKDVLDRNLKLSSSVYNKLHIGNAQEIYSRHAYIRKTTD